jgi:hypothetical protein
VWWEERRSGGKKSRSGVLWGRNMMYETREMKEKTDWINLSNKVVEEKLRGEKGEKQLSNKINEELKISTNKWRREKAKTSVLQYKRSSSESEKLKRRDKNEEAINKNDKIRMKNKNKLWRSKNEECFQ